MITKAVFPVGGLGTRFLPATKAVPKEMLPVVDRPLLQYAVEDALRAGATDLLFITSRHKRALEDHYDAAPELERELEAAGKDDLLRELRQVTPRGAQVTFVRQSNPRGVAHALWCARSHLHNEPFFLAFPDDLLHSDESSCSQLLRAFERTQAAVIGVQRVEEQFHHLYGMLSLAPALVGYASVSPVLDIVEKPKGKAPSAYAAVGRYVLTPDVFARVCSLSASTLPEWPFTQALASAAADGALFAKVLEGRRFDCGSKLGYMQANFALGLAHPLMGDTLKDWLRAELLRG